MNIFDDNLPEKKDKEINLKDFAALNGEQVISFKAKEVKGHTGKREVVFREITLETMKDSHIIERTQKIMPADDNGRILIAPEYAAKCDCDGEVVHKDDLRECTNGEMRCYKHRKRNEKGEYVASSSTSGSDLLAAIIGFCILAIFFKSCGS